MVQVTLDINLYIVLAAQIGLGILFGFIVGYVIKKIGKMLIVLLGLISVFLGYLVWKELVIINYEGIYATALRILEKAKITIIEFNFPSLIASYIPFVGSFIVGLVIALKKYRRLLKESYI